MTLQQKKSKEFAENLEKFQKYRDYVLKLYDNGVLTQDERDSMISAAADTYDV